MNPAYPAAVYRPPGRRRVQQGDVAIAEYHQLRARSGDRGGPGPQSVTSADLPFLGAFTDLELPVTRADGREDLRTLRVWTGPVMVLHQNCEIEFASPNDSRLTIAPLVSVERWPEGPWTYLRRNMIPGYFYMPALSVEEAHTDGIDLDHSWPESVVALASATLSSIGAVKPRRVLALRVEVLPHLHDCISRFYGVRGFADAAAVDALRGKTLVRVVDSGQTVSGPSKLMKMYFSSDGDPEEDDEATVTFWGIRP